MKKLLIVLVVLAVLVWVASWFHNPAAVRSAAVERWPDELGTLDDVALRYPARVSNAAARELESLARALPSSGESDAFLLAEMAKPDVTIASPPTLPDLDAIRILLLRKPLAWPHEGGVAGVGDTGTSDRRATLMSVARALVASALARARQNDAAAWEELRAVANLARSLDRQPQMMEQTAAMAMRRMINAVAWKMPLPVPQWFADGQQHDPVPRLIEAFQYQVASYSDSGDHLFPTKMLADSVEHDRAIAVQLAAETRCDVTVSPNDLGVDLSSVWRRAFRARAELEATANAIRVREGKPIETTSRCSDGTWSFDGRTLRFSRTIETAPPDTPMPLVLHVEAM